MAVNELSGDSLSSAGGADSFKKRLALLKHLDSIIDFSRATSQLELVLYLYSAKRPVTTEELATSLGCSKKSVLDSLRKLEKKDLVVKEKEGEELKVSLSERGIEFVAKIIELFKSAPQFTGELSLTVPVRINIAKEIVTAINLYKLIVYVGLTRLNKPVPVGALSKLIGISKNELEVLVNSFTQPPTKLFKLVRINNEDAILLDKQGIDVLRKTPHYKMYTRLALYRALVKITGTPWTNEMLLKVNSACAGVFATLLTALTLVGVNTLTLTLVALAALVALLSLNVAIYICGRGAV